jgi:molecular chaperone GrpE
MYRIPIKTKGQDAISPQMAAPTRERTPEASREAEWKDRAMRLQAEMDNFRKRQQRNARDEVRKAEDRLLSEILSIADNLDRSLAVGGIHGSSRRGGQVSDPASLLEGIEITRDAVLKLLREYGVERVEADGRPFDPRWHEAVDVVSAASLGVEPGTVAEVRQPGYSRAGRLLRPARVVVAQHPERSRRVAQHPERSRRVAQHPERSRRVAQHPERSRRVAQHPERSRRAAQQGPVEES